jgi:hypothetical protein
VIRKKCKAEEVDNIRTRNFAKKRHDKGEKREIVPISIILSKKPLTFRGESKIAKLNDRVNSHKQVPEKAEKTIESESKY